MALALDFTFDASTYRHYMNGFLTVLHCHHYMCLYTKTAEQFQDCGGVEILQETAEDSIRPIFDDYFVKHQVTDPAARLQICANFYAAMGLGCMEVTGTSAAGTATLKASHVDQGWIKKWGKRDQPVNYFTCGYLNAAFAAAFGRPARSFASREESSMVSGNGFSRFAITQR